MAGMWLQGSTVWGRQSEGSGMFDTFKEQFTLDGIASDMLDSVKKHTSELISLERWRETFSAARKLRYNDVTDVVRQLDELGDFQFANEALQPFLVAMPEYRKLYNEKMATGYENGYSQIDAFRGNAYMHTDDNYREVTSGMSTQYDDEKIWIWASNENRANRLTSIQKVEMQINWTRMRDFDWEDGDPCSELGATC